MILNVIMVAPLQLFILHRDTENMDIHVWKYMNLD